MNQKVVVRKIQSGENKAVWKVAKTLSMLERYFFYLFYLIGKANALVAVDKEKIVGCVIPKVTTLAGEKIGSVDGIFADRNVQGKGVGKALAVVGFWVNSTLVFFNLIPIFPFSIFDGRKIFLWNKTLWSLLVMGFILLVGTKIFL